MTLFWLGVLVSVPFSAGVIWTLAEARGESRWLSTWGLLGPVGIVIVLLMLMVFPTEEPTTEDETDLVELLGRLGKLRDAGALSEHEFAAKKAELLRRI